MTPVRNASSANEGFFQTLPIVQNQFNNDVSFQRVLKLFLPTAIIRAIGPDLERFGQEVLSKKILDLVTDAERNLPYLKGSGRDAFGQKTSELVVGEGWRKLQEYGISQGIVAVGYEGKFAEYDRIVQYLKNHLWTASCANVTCPSAMTDGAAKLLGRHLSSKGLEPLTQQALQDAYNRLTSRDTEKAWTSGQWMTERKGGSDVSGTETVATYSSAQAKSTSDTQLGPWSVDGFKWFSSATDSSMAIILAQTPKGLSAFFAPMRLPSTDSSNPGLNGISIQRLKNKFGTKSLPTAELELKGTRAYLIGEQGQGIQEIATILNITRLYSAVGSLGFLGRGLAIAKAFADVREVGAGRGKRIMLKDNSLHMNTMAKIHGEYHAMMLFTFFIAWLVGIDENPQTLTSPSKETSPNERLRPTSTADLSQLLRVLTPVLKAVVCKRSIHYLQECMEALGGVGYLDNTESESLNIARLYRDCCVNSIWEGTTDVLSSDTVRVLKGRNGQEVVQSLDRLVRRALGKHALTSESTSESKHILGSWDALQEIIITTSADEMLPRARDVVFKLADIVMGVLLRVDLEQDFTSPASEVCFRFLKDAGIAEESSRGQQRLSWKENLEVNQRIVFGESSLNIGSNHSKL